MIGLDGSRPMVSVVMPVRNEAASIDAAVRSVLAQSYDNLELLVVDGRSEDRTREIVGALAERDPRVRLVDNPERIIPAAMNVGLHAARGGVLVRVDGHATVSPDYIERGVEILGVRPDVAGVGGRRVGVASTPKGRAIALALSNPVGVGNSINHYGREQVDTDHASFGVYRVDVARAIDGWDEDLPVNEDVDFDHRLRLAGHSLVYNPEMDILWLVRPTVQELFRQYRRYGRGKGAMVLKNGRAAICSRHLAPPALVVAVAGTVGLALTGRPWGLAVMAPYAAFIGVGSVRCWRSRGHDGDISPWTLPAALVAMHLAWGCGFLEGVVARRRASSGSLTHPSA